MSTKRKILQLYKTTDAQYGPWTAIPVTCCLIFLLGMKHKPLTTGVIFYSATSYIVITLLAAVATILF